MEQLIHIGIEYTKVPLNAIVPACGSVFSAQRSFAELNIHNAEFEF